MANIDYNTIIEKIRERDKSIKEEKDRILRAEVERAIEINKRKVSDIVDKYKMDYNYYMDDIIKNREDIFGLLCVYNELKSSENIDFPDLKNQMDINYVTERDFDNTGLYTASYLRKFDYKDDRDNKTELMIDLLDFSKYCMVSFGFTYDKSCTDNLVNVYMPPSCFPEQEWINLPSNMDDGIKVSNILTENIDTLKETIDNYLRRNCNGVSMEYTFIDSENNRKYLNLLNEYFYKIFIIFDRYQKVEKRILDNMIPWLKEHNFYV